nr:PREDICTED: uncharacterized protein LOC100883788 [Megachile rotundata]XP_012150017.1 PREDICTED: uncharacterized protein LOC100883788 [Megachile rotundata]XP_012150018.1 PREDICTED: uncharacterized protein LOC100883788 [Megachile rotundata]
MDSHVGLDYIVDNPDYCVKLASALDTACTSVKKQVVELLSALCVYSQDGRQRAIDTLHEYQKRKGERYRLRIVVEELQNATAEDYRTALLAFINCLVISTPVLKDRIRIRNEFIGLKLLPILNELRKSHSPDLRVQLDAFDDQRETDEELSNHGPPGIDLSSHVDVFYAILGQIADTPQEIPFLSILQHLLRLDPKDAASDLAWDTAETLVHRATLLENREDATKLLRSPSLQTNLCCHCRGTDQTCGTSRKASLQVNNSTAGPQVAPPLPPPPPPAGPLTPNQGRVLPPPPPPPLFATNATHADASMEPPPIPPPLHVLPVTRAPTPEQPNNHARLLPQQEIPTPKAKMKTINWNKIPNHKVIGKRNIWSLVANEHQNSPMADLDWAEMEGLFCQQVPPMLPAASCSSYGATSDAEKRRREPTEIALLDGKRSLNVNIFLKQFRSSNEDIIRLIKEGGHDDIGAEKLRGLLKILPEVDELEMLKSFDGDKSKLGNAEKFFLQLVQVPNYKLRIECMLLKEEFAANMAYLEPSINSMILAGEDLMTNKPLQEMLYMVLVAGNFLNSGGYAGNAAGVKLSSLQKLTEIRANKPGMNLIHYVALQAERKRKDLLDFTKNMTALEAATKTTTEQLNNEFNALDTKIKKIKAQIQYPSTEIDIQEQMAQFLQMAEQEMSQLKRDMEELETLRRSLAEFFCEDANTFKIEECFKVFHQFCQKFNQAVAENERRRIQEEQVLARRKQREEQLLAKKRLLTNQAEAPTSESECNLADYDPIDFNASLLSRNYSRSHEAKIKRLQNGGVTSDDDVSITGSPNIRRRLGSCSGGTIDHQSAKEEIYSPDVTPNGTLRRRRSRIPCEDDDGNLMDFLRTSGQDGTRERKSWGSLDRSWARKARGQSRRSDLLNADFSGDRERPSSPSPLIESKPFLQEEETKPAGKAWRQKIEAWLSENEKEDRAGEELQKKARQLHQANRRSFEDSESEGKTNTPTESNSTREAYSDIYDWRPSVEKTDVMRTMEAIEEAETHPSQKDKSPWRKSSLNVPNSMEETDPRYSRRLRSRLSADNVLALSTLQSIKEEDRKRNRLQDAINSDHQDELTIYLRQPYANPQASTSRKFSKLKKGTDEEKISDKIEIDSDNIETPPATRKLFSPPKEVKPVEKEPCKRERCNGSFQSRDLKVAAVKNVNGSTDLGAGNFDRYSAARRTRRYKKAQDSAEKESKQEAANSESFEEKPVQRPHTLPLSEEGDDEDFMLRAWQDKLKRREASSFDIDTALADIVRSGEDLQRLSRPLTHRNSRLPVSQPPPVVAVTNTVLSPVMQESRPREPSLTVLPERAVTSRERQRSMIDPSQVKEAIRLANNPPSQVNQSNDNEATLASLRLRKSDDSRKEERNEDRTDSVDESKRRKTNDQIHDRNGINVQPTHPETTDTSVFHGRFVPDISVTASPTLPVTVKGRDQEMNDEGFEETQSLVSETLSQETSSGNYETDTHDSIRCSPAELRYTRNDHERVHIDATEHLTGPTIENAVKSSSIKVFDKRANAVKRASEKSSFLPKRTNGIKRTDVASRKAESMQRNSDQTLRPNNNPSRNEVERSGSRSSLRSSRSSLNSATSVNTVRNLVPNHAHLRTYTSAICALTNDLRKSPSSGPPLPKSTEKRRTNPRATISRIPASRSSSSGSSVGPTARTIRKSLGPTIDAQKGSKGRTIASRSSSSGSGSSTGQQPASLNRANIGQTSTSKSKLIQPRAGTRNHSFMRPTAASVNKGSTPNLPRSIRGLVK